LAIEAIIIAMSRVVSSRPCKWDHPKGYIAPMRLSIFFPIVGVWTSVDSIDQQDCGFFAGYCEGDPCGQFLQHQVFLLTDRIGFHRERRRARCPCGSFYAGLGLGQVPGGIIAARIGPRKTGIYGTILASSMCLLSGLTSGFYRIVLLRLVAGLGIAFVFAPGVALIAKYFGPRVEGFGVGVLSSSRCCSQCGSATCQTGNASERPRRGADPRHA